MNTSSHPADLYARITARIVADLAQGVRPWLKPWTSGQQSATRPLRHNGEPYRGINVLLLWGEAIDKGFTAPMWMTYRQAAALGAQVRQGEKGSPVVFADRVTKTETDDQGEDTERTIAFLKAYTVFNIEQIDGLPARFGEPAALDRPKRELIAAAEEFFVATGAVFRHGGDRACYVPSADLIRLPAPEAFDEAESYTATKAHELIHWTGNGQRLARTFGKRFGDAAYAVEELVAELGSAFLCADFGVTLEPRADHASYLAHWLAVLKADKRAIFTAAAQAQRAADFLHAMTPVKAGEAALALQE